MDSWTLKAAIMCHEALNLLFTKECYWAPFYILFYMLFRQFAECTSTDCK
jgi:hypothetical protein